MRIRFLNNIKNQAFENLRIALNTIRSQKLRSFLTVIGVVIGVITVMLISSIISGIDVGVTKEIESFGTRSIFITKYDVSSSAKRRKDRNRKELTVEDSEAVSRLSAIENCVPVLDITNNFFGQKLSVIGRNGKTSTAVTLKGTYPEYERVGTEMLSEGRWFIKSESEAAQNLAVIGSSVADDFFGFGSPIGQTIDIGGREFKVIGTLQKREQFLGGGGNNQSNVIYVPYGTAKRLKPNSEDIELLATAREGQMEKAKEQINELLRVRRNVPFGEPDNFGLTTADSLIESFRSITQGVALIMILVSSIGLLIGGVGVMNIMLVSVAERTREIGIRKAIGAKKSDILVQFLVEAMTLTGFGGIVGLFIGWLATLVVGLLIPSYVPLWAPIFGFLVSVGIGLVFGILPAWKAARLDPIEALRYE